MDPINTNNVVNDVSPRPVTEAEPAPQAATVPEATLEPLALPVKVEDAPAWNEQQWQQITDSFGALGPAIQCHVQLALDASKVPASVDPDGRRYFEQSLQGINQLLQDGTLYVDPATVSLVAVNTAIALQRFMPQANVIALANRWIAGVGFSLVPPEFEIELTPAGSDAYETLLGGAAAGIGPGLIKLGVPGWAAGPMSGIPLAFVKFVRSLSKKNPTAIKLSFFPLGVPFGLGVIPEPA
jgi:hypothetical protein